MKYVYTIVFVLCGISAFLFLKKSPYSKNDDFGKNLGILVMGILSMILAILQLFKCIL